MTSHDEMQHQALVLQGTTAAGETSPTVRLLADRGYEVQTAATLEEAVEHLQTQAVDLLVVDADASARRAALEAIAQLPVDQRPRQVAIYAERSDEQLNALRRRVSPAQVSVLLRPLHLHRLLTVLRRIEGDAPRLARA